MKFSLVAIAFAAAVSAQSRSDIPECAIGCLDDVIKSKTSCSVDDFNCVCKNFEALQGDATPCVLEKCGAETALNQVLPAVQKLCAAVSASPSSSAAAATSSGSASASASASASSSASSGSSSASKSAATTPASSTGTTKPTSNPSPTVTSSTSTVPTGAAGQLAPLGALAIGALAFAL
ncbi:unnamed protein product [Clonostachys solani]|uniref:CFEM domain-containing protein n=1 Tax=Clonostachys solani TaxID=160281 RepID=A0A9N9W678_9HYPO|nr:unnamed protein product [Clonostachys solani]